MPAIRTPTVAQQRIVLIVFAVVIGAAASWQSVRGSDSPVQKFASTSLPEFVSDLDFSSAEAAWNGLTIDAQGNLSIDALTETALVEAIALTRNPTSEQATERATARAALLLEKQFGASASRQVMELLPLLARYKDAEQRWLAENGAKNPLPHAELFQLQDAVFGKTLAKKMFSQQRRLAQTMLASEQIRNDSRLKQEEKDQALRELERTFQREEAPVE